VHVADCVAVVGAACSLGSAGGGGASAAEAVAALAVEGGAPAGCGALAQAVANRA